MRPIHNMLTREMVEAAGQRALLASDEGTEEVDSRDRTILDLVETLEQAVELIETAEIALDLKIYPETRATLRNFLREWHKERGLW